MPTLYRTGFRKSNTRNLQFARGLALDAHPKSRWVYQDPDFTDHAPDVAPERLGTIADCVIADVGQAALDHWLREAARTHGEEHEAALQIAQEIATMIGVPWAEVMSEEAARSAQPSTASRSISSFRDRSARMKSDMSDKSGGTKPGLATGCLLSVA